jgi:mono/diheme cytochrome c family protein
MRTIVHLHPRAPIHAAHRVPLPVLLLIAIWPLGLAACSLSEDITPPPGFVQPTAPAADLGTAPATEVVASPGPTATPEPIEPPQVIDLQAGQAIYIDRCAACHGPRGLGDGELAAQLSNPPTAIGREDLARSVSPVDWFRIVTFGNMQQFMPPFGNALSTADRWDVTYYALSLAQAENGLAAASELYATQCAACHGQQGAGDGSQAGSLSATLTDLRQPATLNERSAQDIFDLLTDGTTSGMPAFGASLSEDERWNLVSYVRSLSTLAEPTAVPATTEPGSAAASATLAEGVTAAAEVSGLVTNGSTQLPAANVAVSLRRFDGTEELEPIVGQTDGQGHFRFEKVEFTAQRAVIVQVDYLNVSYFSEVAQAQAGETALDLPVTVYDISHDTSAISVDRLHLFLEPLAGEQAVRVGALALLTNSDTRAIVAANAGEGTLFFDLPKSAVNLQLQEGELGGRFIQTDTGFADTLAVIPGVGSHQIVFAFDVPYTRRAELQFPMRYPVAGEIIVVPEGMRVESESLADNGLRQIEGASYRTYSGGTLAAGQTLTLTLSGTPVTAGSTGAQGYELVIAAALLGAVLVGAGVWGWLRSRRDESQAAEAEDATAPEDAREALLQSIADLDDDFQAGRVPKDEYTGRRAALKEQLLELEDDETP